MEIPQWCLPGVSSTSYSHPPYTPIRRQEVLPTASPHSALVLWLTPNWSCWLFLPSLTLPPGLRATLLPLPPLCLLPTVPRPSAWPSPTSQMHTSQGSSPGWKLSPGSYFRPSCSQSWAWGKGRIGPASLHAGNSARGREWGSLSPRDPQPPGFGDKHGGHFWKSPSLLPHPVPRQGDADQAQPPCHPAHPGLPVPEHRGQQSPGPWWGWAQELTQWTRAQVTTPS